MINDELTSSNRELKFHSSLASPTRAESSERYFSHRHDRGGVVFYRLRLPAREVLR